MNEKKEIYENAEMEVIEFETEDIITTSGGNKDMDAGNLFG